MKRIGSHGVAYLASDCDVDEKRRHQSRAVAHPNGRGEISNLGSVSNQGRVCHVGAIADTARRVNRTVVGPIFCRAWAGGVEKSTGRTAGVAGRTI